MLNKLKILRKNKSFYILRKDTGEFIGEKPTKREALDFANRLEKTTRFPEIKPGQKFIHATANNDTELHLILARGFEPYAVENGKIYLKKPVPKAI